MVIITEGFDIYGYNWRTFFERIDKDGKIVSCWQNGEIIVEVGGNMCLTVQNISVI